MLYLYDEAIAEDLKRSFNTFFIGCYQVKVIDFEQAIDLIAQIKQDHIKFPIVTLERDSRVDIDTSRTNFTMMHKGVACVFDNKTNTYYNEKVIPIKLSYELSVIATNTSDIDELVREIIFKYISMYFLTIKLPYESDRRVRFGVSIDKDYTIERSSGSSEYINSGQLYLSKLKLNCEGCVMVDYTPVKLRRVAYELDYQ